ncbi:DNA photolyase family protein [Aestuariimicrobium sp. p3-SID1156]|uniref:cryptochrome/photolyase family protein n=1 Tax=Aestuariimicrobium sp. p3-SID1156 TaxID=2916038 RepID=UPI00223B0910|nr:deoxyribodipyrimidine photo-lyase [Aestuariimicrobium sp. p3-SID1156]MCT1459206.1 DNA photolyase family protein [Aestuariimicrobium sp. p3-SID1156]
MTPASCVHDPSPTLLWLREDLRTSDHEALMVACADGGPVVALWIREECARGPGGDVVGPRPPGAAVRWWTHRSLEALTGQLEELGIPLLFARGDARMIIPAVAHRLGAGVVRWQRRHAPAARALDAQVKAALLNDGLQAHSHAGALLVEPWMLTTHAGEPYGVFTPFYRAASDIPVAAPLLAPDPVVLQSRSLAPALEAMRRDGLLVDLDALGLLDRHPAWWAETVERHWIPGEPSASERLDHLEQWMVGYRSSRDRPGDPESTSRLSPHLRAGELSPRQLLHVARTARDEGRVGAADAAAWVRQLYWREFCWHLAFHRPDVSTVPMRPNFARFPYQHDENLARAWREGATGIDLVDAGMRQLWQTGWMHNRVRMLAASLFTKNLLLPWQEGEQWFWDTLVDADEANNPVSWQWVAGCGADAAPYFRVFNPELQRERFDPGASYTSRWLPQGTVRPRTPVVDLKNSRAVALAAYQQIRRGGSHAKQATQPVLPSAGTRGQA